MRSEPKDLGPCPVCGRAMVAEPSVDRHHWVPKSAGGRETEAIHVVCHRMIHRVFNARDLAADYAEPEAVRAHPEIARFVAWVRRKPAGYVDWPREARKRRDR
jgi:hypothetical protein